MQSNSISGSWAPTAAGSYTIYSEAFTGRSGGERVNGTSGYPGYFDGAANKRITINVSRSPTGSLQLLDTSKSAIAMTNGKWELPLGRQFYVRINGSDVDAKLDQFYIRLNYPDSGQAYWANQVRDYGDAANGRRDYGPFTADRLGDWKVWGHVADAVARPWGSVTPWDGNANGWATFGQYTVSVINRAPDSVSVTVSATTISYGESVQITGTLTDPDGNLTKHALYVCPPKADGSSQFVPYIRPLNSAGFNSPEWTDGWSGGPWNNGFAMGGSTSVVGGTFKPNRAGVWGIHTNGTDVEGLGGPGGGHTVWVTVNKAANVITFNALPYRLTGDPAFTLAATASSGLPVSFVVVSGPVSLSNGTTLSLTGATGAVTIRATQPGNENYVAAVPVERSFTVYAATGDADGDGVENYIEREAGTDLTNPNDASIQLYEYDKTGRLKKGPGGEYIVDAEGNITEVKQ